MDYNKKRKYKVAALKTLLWWAGNIVAGLAPIWILILIGLPRLNSKATDAISHEYVHLIHDGVITFFALALIGSIAVDVYLSRRQFKSDTFTNGIIFVSISIGVFVSIYYMLYVLAGEGTTHFGENKTITISVSIVSFIFCSVGKFSLILKELE